MKKRVVYRIQLTPDAKKRLLNLSEQFGVTQVAMTSRMVEWFTSQPDMIQAAILGLYPELLKKEVATLILERMASDPTTQDKK